MPSSFGLLLVLLLDLLLLLFPNSCNGVPQTSAQSAGAESPLSTPSVPSVRSTSALLPGRPAPRTPSGAAAPSGSATCGCRTRRETAKWLWAADPVVVCPACLAQLEGFARRRHQSEVEEMWRPLGNHCNHRPSLVEAAKLRGCAGRASGRRLPTEPGTPRSMAALPPPLRGRSRRRLRAAKPRVSNAYLARRCRPVVVRARGSSSAIGCCSPFGSPKPWHDAAKRPQG